MRSTNTVSDIRQWFDTPLGQNVAATQSAVLDQLLPGFFGYHLLQLSVQERPLYASSPIQHKFCMGLGAGNASPVIGESTNLPLADDSMDVVVLHHLLDFCDLPQQILREVVRVTVPMGNVIIIGFNPLSLWGLYKPLGKMKGRPPWGGRFIRTGRLLDWLTLLDFRIDRVHYSTFGPPISACIGNLPDYSEGLSRKSNLPFGATYAVVARKHVGAMTPIRPVWKQHFAGLTVVRPASRTGTRPGRDTGG
jgi:SAM-dependent methyltransferase